MPKPKSDLNVLSANRLTDGIVVFWSKEGKWSEWIDEADVAEDAEWVSYLIRVGDVDAQRNIVVEPYLVPVKRSGAHVEPLHVREKFRTLGPSVRRDLGKQAREFANQPVVIAAE